MGTIRCKMCDALLRFQPGDGIAKCEYCGTDQTLPKFFSEKKELLYDRAEVLRKQNDYDGAKAIYEEILLSDAADAEAYWSLVLCDFGIEYVENLDSGKRIPTINRMQYQSILCNGNYLAACEHADAGQKMIYERRAQEIANIQKGIMEIAQKEEPFDIFICYKETDANGRRTPDSVLANEVYYALREEGYRVFYARITLENQLGCDYEPYIFSALQSAKMMIVIGTKPEYFEAVWVKNEWSRYLQLIQKGEKKQLIPAYKGMDPYLLPKEFQVLHTMDMGELGFLQDLVRGIKKVIEEKTPTLIQEDHFYDLRMLDSQLENIDELIARGDLLLQKDLYELAYEVYDDVLNLDAHYAKAYFMQFLAVNHCKDASEYLASLLQRKSKSEKKSADVHLEAYIKEIISIYSRNGFMDAVAIRNRCQFDDSFVCWNVENEEQEIKQNKNLRLLQKASSFANGEEKDIYTSFYQQVIRELDELKRHDEVEIQAVKDRFAIFKHDKNEEFEREYEQWRKRGFNGNNGEEDSAIKNFDIRNYPVQSESKSIFRGIGEGDGSMSLLKVVVYIVIFIFYLIYEFFMS